MHLEGSCHCGQVRFRLESAHPYPFNLCYCSICRKTAGGGGFAINLGGEAASLAVEGEGAIAVYRATVDDGDGGTCTSPCERRFCRHCGSALWVWDPRWPDLIHPFASSIDTPLPVPPERVHLLLDSRADWAEPTVAEGDKTFAGYPEESIEQWHRRLGLER